MRSVLNFPVWLAAGFVSVALINAQETPPAKPTPAKPTPAKPTPAKPPAATGGSTPSRVALNKYHEEQFRRLRGEIEELKNAYNLQIRKGQLLEAEMRRLRTSNEIFQRELTGKFASMKDIADLAEKIRELDKNRRNDVKVTNAQIDEILKIVKKLGSKPVAGVRNPGNGPQDPAPQNFKYREHVVQAGEFLSTILSAYNKAFKESGLKGRTTQSEVVKANSGLNPNRLFVGQKIRIPEPGEIK